MWNKSVCHVFPSTQQFSICSGVWILANSAQYFHQVYKRVFQLTCVLHLEPETIIMEWYPVKTKKEMMIRSSWMNLSLTSKRTCNTRDESDPFFLLEWPFFLGILFDWQSCNLLPVFDLHQKWLTLLLMISHTCTYPYLIYISTPYQTLPLSGDLTWLGSPKLPGPQQERNESQFPTYSGSPFWWQVTEKKQSIKSNPPQV